jgi:hypothetical protein
VNIDSNEKIVFKTLDKTLIIYDPQSRTTQNQSLETCFKNIFYFNDDNLLFFTWDLEMGIFSMRTRSISSIVSFERTNIAGKISSN